MDFFAALLLGVMSAPHCVAMCGGIATALLMSGNRPPENPVGNPALVIASSRQSRLLTDAMLFGGGKMFGYVLLGAVAGTLGMLLGSSHGSAFMVLRILAGALLIALGLYTAGWWLGLQQLERAAYRLWQPALAGLRRIDMGKTGNKLTAGLLWGLLPCGIVYSVLGMAVASGDVLSGMLIMALFGLGTLPFVLSAGGLLQLSLPALARPAVRKLFGAMLIGFGIISVLMATRH
jgi:uncharacterized protein